LEAGRVAQIGLAVGLAGSVALTRFMRALLYAVKPIDPMTMASVAALLLFAAFLPSYLPARRASKIDPTAALREE
jgi:ABC-type antimicrobial peptide transport system permease subunit